MILFYQFNLTSYLTFTPAEELFLSSSATVLTLFVVRMWGVQLYWWIVLSLVVPLYWWGGDLVRLLAGLPSSSTPTGAGPTKGVEMNDNSLPDEDENSKRRKKIVSLVVAGVLLVGGALLTWWWLTSGGLPPDEGSTSSPLSSPDSLFGSSSSSSPLSSAVGSPLSSPTVGASSAVAEAGTQLVSPPSSGRLSSSLTAEALLNLLTSSEPPSTTTPTPVEPPVGSTSYKVTVQRSEVETFLSRPEAASSSLSELALERRRAEWKLISSVHHLLNREIFSVDDNTLQRLWQEKGNSPLTRGQVLYIRQNLQPWLLTHLELLSNEEGEFKDFKDEMIKMIQGEPNLAHAEETIKQASRAKVRELISTTMVDNEDRT